MIKILLLLGILGIILSGCIQDNDYDVCKQECIKNLTYTFCQDRLGESKAMFTITGKCNNGEKIDLKKVTIACYNQCK